MPRSFRGVGQILPLLALYVLPVRPAADPHPARRGLQPASATGNRARGQMNLTRRFGSGRGRLSLRSRLLAGLITVTALFLIIMGVVTTVVLGNSEQSQFNSDLSLTARIKLTEVADLTGGYGVVYINIPTRKVGVLSPPSAATTELKALVSELLTNEGARRYFGQEGNPQRVLFGISLPGYQPVTAIWRQISATEAAHNTDLVPAGTSILLIARPNSAVGSEVRGLVAAELITGSILLA